MSLLLSQVGAPPVAANFVSIQAPLDVAARIARIPGFRPASVVAFVYGADVVQVPAVWVPATQTTVTRPVAAPRSVVVFTYGDVTPIDPVWVPAIQPAMRLPQSQRPAGAAFPFTQPGWAPPTPTIPTRQPAASEARSRFVLVGADTPAIAQDLPPWMVAGDVAARVAGLEQTHPDSRLFLVSPLADTPPPPPAPAGKKFGGVRILFDEPIRDDDEALALILTLA